MAARYTRHGSRLAVVAATAVAIIGIAAVPAFAQVTARHGSDQAWTVGTGGPTVWVQDNECDGHRVTAEYYTRAGNYGSFSDPDGCGGNTDFRNSWDGAAIDRIQVCEIGVGCSGWKPN